MNQPLVSVHVITYNQKQFIHETLRSVLDQDYNNIEIVVADDGSTDGTAEIILGYAQQYPDKVVPLIGGPNLGITGNSNRGLRTCTGKYIAFLGGDDIYLPGKISKQVEWFEADSSRVLCGHQVEVFYDDGSPSHPLTRTLRSGQGPRDFIRHGTQFGALSVMVRTECIPKHGFEAALPMVSDGMFFTETLMGGGGFGYIQGTYGRYRKHDNNITNQWDRCVADLAKFFDIIRQRYPSYLKDADIGEANIIRYGYGLKYLNEGDAKKATSLFLQGIRVNPLGYKLWIRLFQSILKVVL
ncbi:MAG: glycosyltransferase family 2 protein [Gallionella sp.]|nr:glycosyltransferase family 2 protein [Gallionella sp.]